MTKENEKPVKNDLIDGDTVPIRVAGRKSSVGKESRMKKYSIRFVVAAAAMMLGSSLFAQGLAPGGRDPDAYLIPLRVGQTYEYADGETFVYREGMKVRPGEVTEQETGKKIKIPSQYAALTLFPYAGFSQAGVIYNSATNSTSGGTRTVGGPLVVGSIGWNLKKKGQALELGAFYFKPTRSSNAGDLTQVNGTYYFTPGLGIQGSYFFSKKKMRVFGAHGVFRLSSASVGAATKFPWEIVASLGLVFNSDPQSDNFPQGAIKRQANTSNLSFALTGSVGVGKRTSLVGTYWTVRDRNVQSTRFGLGIQMRF